MSDYIETFATDETLEKLGFITDYLPQISPMSMLVLTKEDLLGSDFELTEDNYDESLTVATENLKQMMLSLMDEGSVPNSVYSEEDDLADYTEFAERVITETASARPMEFDGDDYPDVGSIATGNILKPDNITGFPDRLIESPMTTIESTAITMWHEAAHLAQDFKEGVPNHFYEFDADDVAKKTYFQAMEDGHPLTEAGWEEMEAQRMVSSFLNPGNDMDFLMHPLTNTFNEVGLFQHMQIDDPTHTTHVHNSAPEHQQEDVMGMIGFRTVNNMMLGMDQFLISSEEFMETGELSLDGQYYLNAETPMEFMLDSSFMPANPIDFMDVGSRVAPYEPVRAMASAEALMESGLFAKDSAEGKYMEGISDYFKTHGDILHHDPEFLELKDHFADIIDKSGFIKDMKFNQSVSDELNSLMHNTHSLEENVSSYYTNLVTAGYNAQDEVAVTKLDEIWRNRGFDFADGFEGGNVGIKEADAMADKAQEIMRDFENVLTAHPELKDNFPNEKSFLSPERQNIMDKLAITNQVNTIEESAVDLNERRVESGLDKIPNVEFGLN